MPPAKRAQGPSTLVWTGDNQDEVVEFCGEDRLHQPRATFGHFWDGQVLLSVWTQGPGGETTYPVRVGETIQRASNGDLSVLGADVSAYQRTHSAEGQ